MRDRAEVDRALKHLRDCLRHMDQPGRELQRHVTRLQIEILEWSTGTENPFSIWICDCQALDAREALRERAKRQ